MASVWVIRPGVSFGPFLLGDTYRHVLHRVNELNFAYEIENDFTNPYYGDLIIDLFAVRLIFDAFTQRLTAIRIMNFPQPMSLFGNYIRPSEIPIYCRRSGYNKLSLSSDSLMYLPKNMSYPYLSVFTSLLGFAQTCLAPDMSCVMSYPHRGITLVTPYDPKSSSPIDDGISSSSNTDSKPGDGYSQDTENSIVFSRVEIEEESNKNENENENDNLLHSNIVFPPPSDSHTPSSIRVLPTSEPVLIIHAPLRSTHTLPSFNSHSNVPMLWHPAVPVGTHISTPPVLLTSSLPSLPPPPLMPGDRYFSPVYCVASGRRNGEELLKTTNLSDVNKDQGSKGGFVSDHVQISNSLNMSEMDEMRGVTLVPPAVNASLILSLKKTVCRDYIKQHYLQQEKDQTEVDLLDSPLSDEEEKNQTEIDSTLMVSSLIELVLRETNSSLLPLSSPSLSLPSLPPSLSLYVDYFVESRQSQALSHWLQIGDSVTQVLYTLGNPENIIIPDSFPSALLLELQDCVGVQGVVEEVVMDVSQNNSKNAGIRYICQTNDIPTSTAFLDVILRHSKNHVHPSQCGLSSSTPVSSLSGHSLILQYPSQGLEVMLDSLSHKVLSVIVNSPLPADDTLCSVTHRANATLVAQTGRIRLHQESYCDSDITNNNTGANNIGISGESQDYRNFTENNNNVDGGGVNGVYGGEKVDMLSFKPPVNDNLVVFNKNVINRYKQSVYNTSSDSQSNTAYLIDDVLDLDMRYLVDGLPHLYTHLSKPSQPSPSRDTLESESEDHTNEDHINEDHINEDHTNHHSNHQTNAVSVSGLWGYVEALASETLPYLNQTLQKYSHQHQHQHQNQHQHQYQQSSQSSFSPSVFTYTYYNKHSATNDSIRVETTETDVSITLPLHNTHLALQSPASPSPPSDLAATILSALDKHLTSHSQSTNSHSTNSHFTSTSHSQSTNSHSTPTSGNITSSDSVDSSNNGSITDKPESSKNPELKEDICRLILNECLKLNLNSSSTRVCGNILDVAFLVNLQNQLSTLSIPSSSLGRLDVTPSQPSSLSKTAVYECMLSLLTCPTPSIPPQYTYHQLLSRLANIESDAHSNNSHMIDVLFDSPRYLETKLKKDMDDATQLDVQIMTAGFKSYYQHTRHSATGVVSQFFSNPSPNDSNYDEDGVGADGSVLIQVNSEQSQSTRGRVVEVGEGSTGKQRPFTAPPMWNYWFDGIVVEVDDNGFINRWCIY